ncbi:MAG: Ig domain-containing protein [Myxococcales bacterium]|nr:Ig domain-containing protein [Myxococcales bacterium]
MATRANSLIVTLFVSLLLVPTGVQAGALCTDTNGTFRFLTDTLPRGSTNAEYIARLVAVNADGPITFSIDGSGDPLNTGLSLDPASGFITGRPTVVETNDIVFCADDTTQQICSSPASLQINAAGGGGNAGSEFDTDPLLDGRVGEPYLESLDLVGGVGPFVFGGKDLPPGLSLDGETGEIVGVPSQAGTFFATFTIIDFGENNKVASVIPITILPASSDFRFLTQFLNNGEVATPYCDTWLTENHAGTPTFGASGLPGGLTIDPATGAVTGIPDEAGTFEVTLTASDGGSTITTNLAMIVAPSSTSGFYWKFFGIPTGIIELNYDRQPPILLDTEGSADVTYSAIGLPAGMSYGATSGELAGTPTDVGIYPVTFTAVDNTTGDTLTLSVEFIVLPPGGGDETQISVNFWVLKQSLKTGNPGKDAWVGQAIFNADRRTADRFDPAVDTLRLAIGSQVLQVDPGMMTGTEKNYSFKSEKGVLPTDKTKLSLAKQTIKWSRKKATASDVVPGFFDQDAVIGSRGYRLGVELDEKGVFRPPFDLDRTSFVVRTGKVKVKAPGSDKAKLSLLLYDPNFFYDPTLAPDLRIRLLDGTDVVFERDFGALGDVSLGTDKRTGEVTWSLKATKDDAALDRIAKFSYQSGKGKMTLSIGDADLAGLPAGEVHLGVELTIGNRTYFTRVTFFEGKTGKYSTKL